MNTIRPDDLESLLVATHQSLRTAGDEAGTWANLACSCGEPECAIHDPGRYSVTLQLDTMAAYGFVEHAAPATLQRAAEALGRLGDVLGFWTDGRPTGPRALLHTVRDRWLAGMGTPLGGPPDDAWMRDLLQVEARNALLLDKLLERLVAVPFTRIADAGAAHARLRRGRATYEAVTACQRTLRAWLDDHDALPQRTLLQEHLLAIIAEAQWTAGEAQDVVQMAEDASHAVLAFGIADPMWIPAAFGGMERIIPLAGLRVALVLEDDPVPPIPH